MTTGPAGKSFDFDRRIEGILVRYDVGSEVHTAISNARPCLAAAIERTRERLGRSTAQSANGS
ncbi:metal-dependent phosphohydrolase [Streptomyces fagopyri]|uniref:metal-dependent phosphohydrolase n=1 Tax=Streptomyces fagopyri TaxID=2662397 RepID=UPI00371A1F76